MRAEERAVFDEQVRQRKKQLEEQEMEMARIEAEKTDLEIKMLRT